MDHWGTPSVGGIVSDPEANVIETTGLRQSISNEEWRVKTKVVILLQIVALDTLIKNNNYANMVVHATDLYSSQAEITCSTINECISSTTVLKV